MWYHILYNLEDHFKNLKAAMEYIQNTDILTPHIPEYRLDFEDNTTPRICVCTSVTGCIQALGTYIFRRCCNSHPTAPSYTLAGREVYPIIVMCLESDHVIKPTTEQVPDAEETDEHWILSPAKVIKSKILWLNPWSIKFEDNDKPEPIYVVTYKTSQIKHLDHPWLNKKGHKLDSNKMEDYVPPDKLPKEGNLSYMEPLKPNEVWACGFKLNAKGKPSLDLKPTLGVKCSSQWLTPEDALNENPAFTKHYFRPYNKDRTQFTARKYSLVTLHTFKDKRECYLKYNELIQTYVDTCHAVLNMLYTKAIPDFIIEQHCNSKENSNNE